MECQEFLLYSIFFLLYKFEGQNFAVVNNTNSGIKAWLWIAAPRLWGVGQINSPLSASVPPLKNMDDSIYLIILMIRWLFTNKSSLIIIIIIS